MPIQIDPPNLGALAALAGRGLTNANLTVPGALGLQALQLNDARQEAAQKNALAMMQLQQQGQNMLSQQDLARQQLQQQGLLAQQQNDLQQRQLGQQANQHAQTYQLDQFKALADLAEKSQTYGLEARKTNVSEQQLGLNALKIEMDRLKEQDEHTIQEKGAFASYARLALDQAKTPEEAQQITTSFLSEALKKKYITPEEATNFAQQPVSARKNLLDFQIMKYGAVNDYKNIKTAETDKSQLGTHITFNPDGSIKDISQDPTMNQKTEAQKDITNANDNIAELKNLYSKVPDDFFGGIAAANQGITKSREWLQGLPGMSAIAPDEAAKQRLKDYSAVQGQSQYLAMDIIKQLSGVQYSDKQLEFLKEILPEVGPGSVRSQFEGRAENLLRMFDRIKEARQVLLSKGLDVNSSEYKNQMLNSMKSLSPQPSGLRQHLQSLGFSQDQIDNELKRRGMQ